jgi:PIN domain nuclease of toxin-antitoxin system
VTRPGPVLADTHIFLWYVDDSPRLTDSTRTILDDTTAAGHPIFISAVTVVELRYLAEKATLTETHVDALHSVLGAVGSAFEVAAMDEAVAWAVGKVPRDAIADPWDRMIAATALVRGVPLVTHDRKLLAVDGLHTVR